ncbi:hypothetical protein HN695_05080 [Candidatus Woesearchaeota archaeon]|nr:hypothetical protein [archaeon]MBT4272020.1 hypothetical protein [archaeon]MBT4858870.1 hypothetical protein [archaeon]MBT5423878.1 hypothetical protein [archaeon]MBT7927687.1 hypothetical protein [Candidatus Woesearchaeota archaeon]
MCRLLVVKSKNEFSISNHLKEFAEICRDSEEYQGHGWGLAYLNSNNDWIHYKNIKPIFEDDLTQFSKTKFLVVHARSAFQDKDIIVKNNMPFYDDKYVFVFNGELSGVRIKEKGRIGAEKIFNFIKRFDKGKSEEMLEKGIRFLKKRTKAYKAINVIIVTKENIFLSTNFSERPNYFTMNFKENDNELIICSMLYENEEGWIKIENNTEMMW